MSRSVRPELATIVWAYDFVFDRTREGRPLKFLTVVGEYTRECLTIEVTRRQTSRDVLRTLAKLILVVGPLLELDRWDVSDRLQQSSVVEPVHPFERGIFHVF